MNEHMRLGLARPNRIVRAALVTAAVLLIPLWGTFYVDGWNWDWKAFVLLGAVVFGAASTYQLIVRTTNNSAYRLALGMAVATALVLTWMNWVLTVEGNRLNVLHLGVVVVGLVGAAMARLRASGMVLALGGTAIAQMLVPFLALVVWKTRLAPGGPFAFFGLNGVFILLFATSALLFRRASRAQEIPGA